MQFVRLRLALAITAWLVLGFAALAEDYPSRPIRIFIPLAAGGGGDVFTRALADQLQKALGQPVLVENRPGGSQNVGARACAEAAPDGYTICVLSTEALIYNQFAFKHLGYNPATDFAPIINLFFNTLSFVVSPTLQVSTISELIALSKSKPGTLSYGSFAFPAVQLMERLKKQTGADIVRVPFRGGGEIVTALLAGTTPVAILALSNMIPQLQSGRIKTLAVQSKTRSPLFPDVPTFAEAGLDYPGQGWWGLGAPKGTPRAAIEKMNAEFVRTFSDPRFAEFLEKQFVVPAPTTPEGFAQFLQQDRTAAESLIRMAKTPRTEYKPD